MLQINFEKPLKLKHHFYHIKTYYNMGLPVCLHTLPLELQS